MAHDESDILASQPPISLSVRKQRALELYLGDRPEDLTSLTTISHTIASSKVDSDHYQVPQTLDDFHHEVALQDQAYPDGKALSRVVRSLAMYAGVYPDDTTAAHFTVHKTLSSDAIHPTAQLRIAQRAARVRAIPTNWQSDPAIRTPLLVSPGAADGFVDISFRETTGASEHLSTAKILEPATPTPLAYVTGDQIMLINPQMVCPLACSFCIRNHTSTTDFGLVNFSPRETAEYLTQKFDKETWDSLRMIKLITGAFRDYPTLRSYVSGFLTEIKRTTSGSFDPLNNSHQKMHLLTNLVQTKSELREIRTLGIRSLEHTVEIIDNDRRRQYLSRATPQGKTSGKGEQTFESMMVGARNAVSVYGPDDYGTTVVLGMDDEATTLRGYQAMYGAGVRQSTGGIFVPNAYTEIGLQQTTFSQTMRLRRAAANLFKLPAVFAPYVED